MSTLIATGASEEAFTFGCRGHALVAVLHHAASLPAPQDTGALVVVGGPQYRAGSHRQFVHLARRLARAGYATLRFDVTGMGDAEGRPAGFEGIDNDIAAAIDALMRRAPNVRRVVLWGLCDGASASLMYVSRRSDPRVAGLCLANPWIRSAASLARTQVRHYYLRRLVDGGFWQKLLRGGIGLHTARDVASTLRQAILHRAGRATDVGQTTTPADYRQCMLEGWDRFPGPILLLLSENDYTAREFSDHVESDRAWRRSLRAPRVRRGTLPGADHTFSSAALRDAVADATLRWMTEGQFGKPCRETA